VRNALLLAVGIIVASVGVNDGAVVPEVGLMEGTEEGVGAKLGIPSLLTVLLVVGIDVTRVGAKVGANVVGTKLGIPPPVLFAVLLVVGIDVTRVGAKDGADDPAAVAAMANPTAATAHRPASRPAIITA
jgi:hypothetical protein